ncbi:MAG: hypothetical protein KAR06_08105 [Deltaproteobacteria bacterium]|nr:hypothetical protein [Deltaproteobacteria bacterium]
MALGTNYKRIPSSKSDAITVLGMALIGAGWTSKEAKKEMTKYRKKSLDIIEARTAIVRASI